MVTQVRSLNLPEPQFPLLYGEKNQPAPDPSPWWLYRSGLGGGGGGATGVSPAKNHLTPLALSIFPHPCPLQCPGSEQGPRWEDGLNPPWPRPSSLSSLSPLVGRGAGVPWRQLAWPCPVSLVPCPSHQESLFSSHLLHAFKSAPSHRPCLRPSVQWAPFPLPLCLPS